MPHQLGSYLTSEPPQQRPNLMESIQWVDAAVTASTRCVSERSHLEL